MNIVINDDYKLTSDALNVIIERRKVSDPTKRPGFDPAKHSTEPTVSWAPVAFCRDVAHALNWYVDHRVRTSEATTFVELRDIIIAHQNEVKALYETRVVG